MAQRTESLTLRIDPKVKYLAEITSRARGCSLTDYIETLLSESFKSVTLRVPPEPEPSYGHDRKPMLPKPPNEEEERAANEAKTVANLADDLWHETEFRRLQSLQIFAPHLLSEEHHALLSYLHSREDLKTPSKKLKGGYKLNREKIVKEWDSIVRAFKKQRRYPRGNTHA